ncbi:LrgB-like protein [Niveomyces insectorum RCEF 264]|uniref:LrgB-like protein n=1 Tax=Niveomyces insectorum RCEF 264 TaxID=1081102 RepID=A0A162MBJ7_9HYPO|nr:LrgB-like protein [Niveomyces insectorum RCEF 264]
MTAPSSAVDPESNDIMPVLKDAVAAVGLVAWSERTRLLRCFVFVPVGVCVLLAACFGVHRLLSLGGVAFPASVACLILLFLALLLCERVLGDRRTKKLVQMINVPGGWSLRWLNIFFTPSFVMLPLSPRISATEVGKIIAVFVIGFVVMMVFTAYMTRSIQLLHGLPRKAMHQRADEVALPRDNNDGDNTGNDTDRIPLLAATTDGGWESPRLPPSSHAAAYFTVRGQHLDDPLSSFSDVLLPAPPMVMPWWRQHPQQPKTKQWKQRKHPKQQPLRAERWAEWLNRHADAALYTVLLLLVGLPVYYATGYAMPLQLAVNVLAFVGVLALPPTWRQVLHPVIVSAFSTLLVIWLLGRVHGDGLPTVLAAYRPGNTYLQLLDAATHDAQIGPPGAGDVLASILDASIVSLALPMYQYRRELRLHFWAIVLPNVALAVASLFVYPVVCHAVGISPARSLAFAARSLTLALATPAVRNLGGDLNTVAAVAILSGVLGVLIGRRMLSWMRIPDDDYVTRGVTLGANASALGTALLLRTDPRAAALSSLAMSLFGTVTVAFSSIPPMVHIIRSLVGLS